MMDAADTNGIRSELYVNELCRIGLGRTPKHGLAQIDQSLHIGGRHDERWLAKSCLGATILFLTDL